ncbi:MAG: TIR domain-containing protein [Actinomycetia bacterium]|nr:TIR domain-containing protein [Actinomycetes bacterium]MCP5035067.1 TIR domain-containing protein [Actinomycetes bacterium]
MSHIFISYRRQDAAAWAALLDKALRSRFAGAGLTVFFDTASTDLGEDYVHRVAEEVRSCDVLLALIGQHWLGRQGGRRRIDASDDLLRRELLWALDAGVEIVPVFVDDAQWSDVEPLPEELRWFRRRHSATIRRDEPGRDVVVLLDRLGIELGLGAEADGSARPHEVNTHTYIETFNSRCGTHYFGGA